MAKFPEFEKFSIVPKTRGRVTVSYNTLISNTLIIKKNENMSDKKTAIEEMIERLEKSGFFLISYDYDIFNEALEKEKEQIDLAPPEDEED